MKLLLDPVPTLLLAVEIADALVIMLAAIEVTEAAVVVAAGHVSLWMECEGVHLADGHAACRVVAEQRLLEGFIHGLFAQVADSLRPRVAVLPKNGDK